MSNELRKNVEGVIFLALYCLTIPTANWMIGHVGTACIANGPCVVPVAPGLNAPSGVLLIGAALVLRDLVQRRLGVEFGIGAIIAGAAISAGLSPPSIVVASASAFLLSEAVDFAVYTPLARNRLVLAVVVSSMIGLVVELVHLPLVGLRLARLFGRAGRRQSLDGATIDPVCGLLAPPRRAARPHPRLRDHHDRIARHAA